MNAAIGQGIGDGLAAATNTLLQIQMYKQKMAADKEQNKIEQNYKKASTDYMESRISAAEQKATQDAQTASIINNLLGGNQPGQQQPGQQPAGQSQAGGNPIAGASSTIKGTGSLPQANSQNTGQFASLENSLQKLPPGVEIRSGGITLKNPGKQQDELIPQDIPIPKLTDSQDVKSAYFARVNPLLNNAIDLVGQYKEGDNTVSAYYRGQGGLQKWQFIGLVKIKYPDWNEQKYQSSQRYRNQLSSGRLHDTTLALNTLAGHLNDLDTVLEEYKGNNLPANQAVIAMAQQISGNTGITDYNVARNVVESETEAALTKVGVTQQGMVERRKLLGSGLFGAGYEQLKQYVKSVGKIAAIRAKNIESDFKKNTFSDPTDEIIDPDNRDIYHRLAPDVKFLSDETGGGNPDIQDKISQAHRLVQQNPQNKGESNSDYKKRIVGMIGNQ